MGLPAQLNRATGTPRAPPTGRPRVAWFVVVVLVATSLGMVGSAAAQLIGGESISATPAHLGVAVTIQPNVTYSNATVVLRAWVTGGGSPIANVTVTFSSSGGGSFFPASGSTGTFGEVNTSLTVPAVGSVLRLVLTASASSTGSGFLPGTGSANLTVNPVGRFLMVTPTFPQGTSVHTGASDLVVARVTNGQGVPVAGAVVMMGTTRGTVSPVGAVSGPSGNVTLTLHAPWVTVATQVWLLFVANATGFANGSSIASVTINSGVAPSLYLTIGPGSGNLSAGESVRVTVTVRSTNATGTLVPDANVTLILSDGQYSPTLALTGSTGTANFTYIAPTSLAEAANVTVTASATATNYAPGATTASFTVAPATPSGPGFLTATWLWILVAVVLIAVLVTVILRAGRRRQAPPPAAPSGPSHSPPAPPAPPAE